MKKLLCYCFVFTVIFFSPMAIAAQQSVADSLLKKLPGEKNDSLKIVLLKDIGFAYEHIDSNKSRLYYLKAIDLAKRSNNTFLYLKSLDFYSDLFFTIGRYDTAEIILQSILSQTNERTSYKITGPALANLGNIYLYQNKYEMSQEYYLKAIAVYEKNSDDYALGIAYSNLFIVLFEMKLDDKAIEYAEKAYNIAKKEKDKEGMLYALVNLASCYFRKKNTSKTLSTLDEALPLGIQLDNQQLLNIIYQNYATTYVSLKKFSSAIDYFTKAIHIARQLSNTDDLGNALSQLAGVYAQEKKFDKANKLLQEAEKLLQTSERKLYRKDLFKMISDVEMLKGNANKAYNYLQKSMLLQDTIYNDATSAKIAELEVRYQTTKKEKDILLLQQESKNKVEDIQKNKRVVYILAGSFISLLLISFLSYRTYNQKQLLQQQQIKELQNEKLMLATESILKGQEDERSRLAQDLHDGLGGMLSGVKLTLSAMKGNIILPEESGRLFNKAFEQLDSSIGEMRRVAHNMMPEALVKLGLQQALQDYCEGINESKQLTVRCEFHGLENRLDNSTEIIVYRIVQELLNNAIKHARANNVLVQVIRKDAELDITIEDDGIGFNKEDAPAKVGAGLTNIQSRVDYLKGELDIKSSPGKGTSVHINCSV